MRFAYIADRTGTPVVFLPVFVTIFSKRKSNQKKTRTSSLFRCGLRWYDHPTQAGDYGRRPASPMSSERAVVKAGCAQAGARGDRSAAAAAGPMVGSKSRVVRCVHDALLRRFTNHLEQPRAAFIPARPVSTADRACDKTARGAWATWPVISAA